MLTIKERRCWGRERLAWSLKSRRLIWIRCSSQLEAEAGGIAADSLAPRRVGELTFPIAQKHVDRVLLVTDQDIRGAQQLLWREMRILAEPGGAAAFAALLSKKYKPAASERVGVLICGGNTDAVSFGD